MSRSKFKILIATGLTLIAAAGALTCYNLYDDYRATNSSAEIVDDIKSQRDKDNSQSEPDETKDITDWHEEPVPDYVLNPNMPMPTITVDGYRYVGTLSIPALEIELPVTEECDYERMRIAVCRYYGSVYLDNMVICGHNYSGFLKSLGNLQVDDDVYFTDAVGNEFHYKVEEIEVLRPTAVDYMISSDYDFTVFTCNYYGSARVTVRCERVDK